MVSYPEVVHDHFKYRHIIDDQNAKRHSPIILEVVWATKWWPHRVFALLLAIAEVNVMLASVHFGGHSKTSMLRFRKQLSHELIYNTYIPQTDEREPRRSPRNELESTHKVCAQPRGKKFSGSEMVDSKINYSQTNSKCCGWKRKVRTYCQCSVGVIRCDDCYTEHIFEAGGNAQNQD